MRICLNAALLAAHQTDYRAAGISHYQSQSLRALGEATPLGWQLEAHVSPETASVAYPGIRLLPAAWSTRRPIPRILWEQSLLPRAARGADLFHAMAFVSPALVRCPQVLTIYDLSFIREPDHLPAARRRYLQIATRMSARRARRILTISAAVAADIVSHFGIARAKIDIAPPGVDRARFHPLPVGEVAAFRQAKQLPARYWLYVGTLEPRKNLPTLLEAYARIPSADRPPLILAGGAGWGMDVIMGCIERFHLGDSVRLPGFLPADELPLWYNGAELFVYPSLHEGFGMPILEAMACGVPVLISDASALCEITGGAGLCAPARDVDAWVACLQRAANDADWRQVAGERSLARATGYSWAETAARTIACYRAALA